MNSPLQDVQQFQTDAATFNAWLHDGVGIEIDFGPGDTRPSLATLIAEMPNVTGLEFPTSNYQTVALPATPLTAADAAAFAAGGILVVNSHETLIAAVVLTSKAARYRGGLITTAGFTLSHPALIDAPQGIQIFDQTAVGGVRGQVTFTGRTKVDYTWWGANNTGSTNGAVELASRLACQDAELAIDGNWGSIVDSAPGTYVLDVGFSVFFRNSHHISRPGTVRFDFDPATVLVEGSGDGVGIFCTCDGSPAAQLSAGARLAGHPALGGGVNSFIYSRDPTTCPVGLIWIGVDIVHDYTPQLSGGVATFLGADKYLFGLQFQCVQGGMVMDSLFFGMPNDGLNVPAGTNKIVNVRAWANGYYGGAANNDSTRNNLTITGNWDITTKSLTSCGNLVLGCDIRAAANSGIAGGLDADFKIAGGVSIGNATGIEGTGQSAVNVTQWMTGVAIAQYGVLYVPGTSPAKSPVGLGGELYYYTAPGTTGATPPVGTTLGANIADGTATCQFIGYMPEDGRVPSKTMISDYVLEGTRPTTLNVPYIGIVAVPASLYGSTDLTGVGALTWNGGNEGTIRIVNVKCRNWGFNDVSASVFNIKQQNGGVVYIAGLEMENCIGLSTGGGTGLVELQLGTAAFGTTENTKVRITISGLRSIGSLGLNGSTLAVLYITGNINYYDIAGVESDGSNGNLIMIVHNTSAVAGYALESGRIANCYTALQEECGIRLQFLNNFAWTNPITLENNRLFGVNASSGVTYFTALYINAPNALTAASGKIVLRGNQFGYGALTDYPILVDANIPAGSLKMDAHYNLMEEGPWKLRFSGNPPALMNTASAAAFSTINANDNGLPGQKNTGGTATPAAGTWSWGDKQTRNQPTAAGVDYERCTTNPGATITGLMNACTGTGVNGTNTVTIALGGGGVLPSAGEYVSFGAGPIGIYRLLNVNPTTLVATLGSNLNNTLTAGTAIVYSTAVTFKGVSLAA